jgi:hypothetical protein
MRLADGSEVEVDKMLAARYFRLSADQRNADAQLNYGWCLAHGSGVDMDNTLAAHYFKFSADRGNADAQLHYDRFHTRVEGIAMDKLLRAHYSGTIVGSSLEGQALRATRLLCAVETRVGFRFVINGTPIETGVAEAAAFSPAVVLELSVDACARTFTVRNSRISGSAAREFERVLSGRSIPRAGANTGPLSLLFGRLSNSDLEQMFFPASPGDRSASNGDFATLCRCSRCSVIGERYRH